MALLRLKRKEVEVEMEGVDGKPVKYILREMSGGERDAYLNSVADRMKYAADGKVAGVKNFSGIQSLLLSACLYGPDGKMVEAKDIELFPASTVGELFAMAQELNALNNKGMDQAKNE